MSARWRYEGLDVEWDGAFAAARRALVETFAATYSRSLQQTLYAMGEAVLGALPAVAEVRLALPNKHHHLVDLAPFGPDNDHAVYLAGDRPFREWLSGSGPGWPLTGPQARMPR